MISLITLPNDGDIVMSLVKMPKWYSRRRYMIQSDILYKVMFNGEGVIDAHIGNGFVTDFASTPRVLWWLLQPTGRCAAAGLLHDWCYEYGTLNIRRDGLPLCAVTRAQADKLLRDGVVLAGCRRATAWAMWAAVRMFGWLHWKGGKNGRHD